MILICWLDGPNFGLGEPSYAGYRVLILRVGVSTIPLLLDGSGSEFISFRVRARRPAQKRWVVAT